MNYKLIIEAIDGGPVGEDKGLRYHSICFNTLAAVKAVRDELKGREDVYVFIVNDDPGDCEQGRIHGE